MLVSFHVLRPLQALIVRFPSAAMGPARPRNMTRAAMLNAGALAVRVRCLTLMNTSELETKETGFLLVFVDMNIVVNAAVFRLLCIAYAPFTRATGLSSVKTSPIFFWCSTDLERFLTRATPAVTRTLYLLSELSVAHTISISNFG